MILMIYIPFCIWLAWENAERIKDDKRIYHALNGFIHLLAAFVVLSFEGWQVAFSLLIAVRIVFNTALNLFRGLSIDYVSPKPKSIVDKVEKWLFGKNGWIPLIIYSISLLWVLVKF